MHAAYQPQGKFLPELLLRTGDHCPATGWWTTVERDASRFLTEGSLLPSVQGQAAVWERSTDDACSARCASCPCAKG